MLEAARATFEGNGKPVPPDCAHRAAKLCRNAVYRPVPTAWHALCC